MYSGIWTYAWDLADEGVDHVMGWAADSGLQALQVATAYHAGWFIHPHNPKHRAYMTEDGCVYFHPEPARYKDTVLKPKVASVCFASDWIREAGKRLDRHGLKLVSWTVCAHNTRLGLMHPECTVRNCFGDSYPHALCPANHDVRKFIIALCGDLANNLPLHAIQLESPGYMGLAHGHHHERDLTVLTSAEQFLMDLCFCKACVRTAESKHVEIGPLRESVRKILAAGMAAAPGRPSGYPDSIAVVRELLPGLDALLAMRQEVEDTLILDIKEAMKPSAAKLFLLGVPNGVINPAVDVYNSGVYGLKPDAILAATKQARNGLTAKHELYMGVRLGLGSVANQQELSDIVRAVKSGGGDGVMFYNYSESPMTALNWIKDSLGSSQ
jgi:hypothetical protein